MSHLRSERRRLHVQCVKALHSHAPSPPSARHTWMRRIIALGEALQWCGCGSHLVVGLGVRVRVRVRVKGEGEGEGEGEDEGEGEGEG